MAPLPSAIRKALERRRAESSEGNIKFSNDSISHKEGHVHSRPSLRRGRLSLPSRLDSQTDSLSRPTSAGSSIQTRSDGAEHLGLHTIHDPKDFVADIIFVHGLGGSPWTTWSWDQNPAFFWPAWLPHEPALSNIRISSFGYHSDFLGREKHLTLLDFATNLLVCMHTLRAKEEFPEYKPIIIIAHSMGGMVVKKAYSMGKTINAYTNMISQVQGIIFLSTPHQGSAHARVLNNLISVAMGSSRKLYISELDTDSATQDDINEKFLTVCENIKLVSLYEALPVTFAAGIKRIIVGKNSGVLGYPGALSAPLNANHQTICKFHDRQDPNYGMILDFLESFVRKFKLRQSDTDHSVDGTSKYKAMLEGLYMQSHSTQDIITRILSWTTCAARPLTPVELQEAMKQEYESYPFLEGSIMEHCNHLIRVENGTVVPVDNTVRDFLLGRLGESQPYIKISTVHEHLAALCLRYLSDIKWDRFTKRWDNSREQATLIPGSYPFFEYARDYWAFHLGFCGASSPNLLGFLEQFLRKAISHWIFVTVSLNKNIALASGSLHSLAAFLHRAERVIPILSTPDRAESLEATLQLLQKFGHDYTRLLSKFGSVLLLLPPLLYSHILPLCPQHSAPHQEGNSETGPLTVKGPEKWCELLTQFGTKEGEAISAIICSGEYLLTHLSRKGIIIVWNANTFQEMRRLRHGEPVSLIDADDSGTLVSAGTLTFRIWNIKTGHQIHRFAKDPLATVSYLRFLECGASFTFSYGHGDVSIYDLRKERVIKRKSLRGVKEGHYGRPRTMDVDTETRHIAVGFQGGSVLVWRESPDEPELLIRENSSDSNNTREWPNTEVPEIVCWQPHAQTLFIVYRDTSILRSDMKGGRRVLYRDTGVRQLVFNTYGTLLLTSDASGTLNVWDVSAFTRFDHVCMLQREDFIQGLAFAPDNQRIYTARASTCQVWLPNQLVPFAKPHQPYNPELDIPRVPAIVDLTLPEKQSVRQITAIACDRFNEFFCSGGDDGKVSLHIVESGKMISDLWEHASVTQITSLEWSLSRRFLASADDAGRVILNRIGLNEEGNWFTFEEIDVRARESIKQLLFHPDETHFCIRTETTSVFWDLDAKAEIWRMKQAYGEDREWILHPHDKDLLLYLGSDEFQVYQWSDMRHLYTTAISASGPVPFESNNDAKGKRILSHTFIDTLGKHRGNSESHTDSTNQKYVVSDIHADTCYDLPNSGQPRKRFAILQTSEINTTNSNISHRVLLDTTGLVKRVLGCFYDRIIFLDRENWICSHEIDSELGGSLIKRFYYIPPDWITNSNLDVLSMNIHGTLFLPINGNVSIIGYRSISTRDDTSLEE